MLALLQIELLAHCGAKWYLCDGATGVAIVGFLGFMVYGLKKAERKAQARAEEYERRHDTRS